MSCPCLQQAKPEGCRAAPVSAVHHDMPVQGRGQTRLCPYFGIGSNPTRRQGRGADSLCSRLRRISPVAFPSLQTGKARHRCASNSAWVASTGQARTPIEIASLRRRPIPHLARRLPTPFEKNLARPLRAASSANPSLPKRITNHWKSQNGSTRVIFMIK